MHCLLVAHPLPMHVLSVPLMLEGPSVQGSCLSGSWWKKLVVGAPRSPFEEREGLPAASKKDGATFGHHNHGPRDKGTD